MDKHWTVTIQVHEVTPPEPLRDGNNYAVKINQGLGKQAVVMTERQVTERFSTTVRADTEEAAYRKAMALLEVNRPEPSVEQEEIRDGTGGLITNRPIRDNPQA